MTQGLPEGTVTILFTDVVGSTELRTGRGDATAHEIMRTHFDILRKQIEDHSGQEVKTIGDSFMVAFGSARRAVECAVAVQRALEEHGRDSPEERVEVRIGLNTGDVIREHEDLFGAAVDAAARISAKAKGGQILIPEAVRAILGAAKDIELTDRGRFRLKGFSERWRLFEVQWQEEAPGAPVLAGQTPYVGRVDERAELRRQLEQAANGRGAVVMIGGEPGVGKTRLAEELMGEARQRDMLALIGHCYEMEGALPYVAYVEMLEAAARAIAPDVLRTALGDSAPEVARLMPELRRVFPDIPASPELPPEQERWYLFNGMRDFLARAAEGQPLLLVLDDLHWADDSSLLLQHIAQQVHEMRVLIVGTYRDVELDVGRPLARTLEGLLRQRVAQRISLRRLPETDVSAMLKALSGQDPPAGLVDVVHSETDGLPFFVEEVFHHLAEEGKLFDAKGRWRADLDVGELDVPEGVRLVIGRRLERVGEACKLALTAAAVIGRRFNYQLLERIGEVEPDALLDAIDDAERAQLITDIDTDGPEARFMFSHELVRQTLLGGLSLPRRQRMHLRVAESIEALYRARAEEHSADMAHHLYQAGAAADATKTVRYLSLAAEQASAAAAFEDALRLYDDALSLQADDGTKAHAGLLEARGLALRSLGRGPEARAGWERAVTVFEDLSEGELAGKICEDWSFQLGWEANWAEALVVAQRGLADMGSAITPGRARLLAHVGMIYGLGGESEAGAPLLEEASSIAGELQDNALLGRVQESKLANKVWYGLAGEAAEIGAQAIQLTREAGRLWNTADATWMTGYALSMLGRFDESVELQEQAVALATRIGHQGGLLSALRGLNGVRFFRSGDLDEFETVWRHDRDEAKRLNNPWISNAYSNLSQGAFWRGRWDESLELAREAARLEPAGMLVGVDWGSLFLRTAYAGTRDDALAMLAEQDARMPNAGKVNTLGRWAALQSIVEGLAVLERYEECGKLYPLAKELVDTGMVTTFWFAQPYATAGIAAMAAEEWAMSDQHFKAALDSVDNLPIVIEQPEVRRWYARMLIDRDGVGDRDKAREQLTEAIAMYTKIGMPKHVEMAEAMLGEA